MFYDPPSKRPTESDSYTKLL